MRPKWDLHRFACRQRREDAAGNGVAASSGTFSVNIGGGNGHQESPASLRPTSRSLGGANTQITVVYTDDGRIRAKTASVDDIVVSRGNGSPLQVTDVSTTAANDGKQLTAVYTVAAPGGTWDTADNGNYAVTVNAGAVLDSTGLQSTAAGGSFTVNATVADNAKPTVDSITAGDITSEGVKRQDIEVVYTDDVGIDLETIGTDDVTITGPDGTLTVGVAGVSSGNDTKSVTVTYELRGPNGDAFTSTQNGTYTIAVNANAVKDTAGKGVAAAQKTFAVNVPAPATVDPAFNNGSPVVTNFTAESVVATADDKLLVVGRADGGAIIERRNADGTLDRTFARTGQVFVPATLADAFYAVVAQGDNVVAAGTSGGDFVLVRYLSTGRIDTSFGTRTGDGGPRAR